MDEDYLTIFGCVWTDAAVYKVQCKSTHTFALHWKC